MRARTPLLSLACGLLGWAALDGAVPSAALPDPVRPVGPEARSAALAAALPAPPAGPWLEQVERPLFASGRRPPAPAAAPTAVEAPPEPPAPVAALGVVLRQTGALALLRLVDERTVRAAEGDEVEGWRVDRIGAEGVDLSRADAVLHLPVRARSAEGVLKH